MVTRKNQNKGGPAGKKKPAAKAAGDRVPARRVVPPARTGVSKKAQVLSKAGRAPSGKTARESKAVVDRKSRPGTRAGAAHRAPAGPDTRERLSLLLQEKGELQDLLAQARAELDSALAEADGLRQKLHDQESESTRRSAEEPQPAGPGRFDPSVDLEDDLANEAEEDLEGAAGFFDRMDEIRARRNELDRERNDRELEQSEQSFWMICPKCGDLMEEQETENVKLERCENCGGLYLDRGEVDLLLSLSSGPEGPRRLHNVLKF